MGLKSARGTVVNFAIFQVVYFACVIGAARGNAWIGPLVGLALLPINLAFIADRGRALRFWLLVGAVGTALDSILVATGVLAFPPGARLAPEALWTTSFVPLWIATLWIALGTLLTSSLAWLGPRPLLAALLGAAGGAFSFWSASRLGATELPSVAVGVTALAVEYALLLPILAGAAPRPDEHAAEPLAPEEPPQTDTTTASTATR
ncbi:MAG: DUF2878 domain-containing protein [Planctomycetota bacterium]